MQALNFQIVFPDYAYPVMTQILRADKHGSAVIPSLPAVFAAAVDLMTVSDFLRVTGEFLVYGCCIFCSVAVYVRSDRYLIKYLSVSRRFHHANYPLNISDNKSFPLSSSF